MNFKDNLIFFLSIFPIFVIKSNFDLTENLLIFSVFLIFIVCNFYILRFVLVNKKFLFHKLYISLIITIGIDNHLGLFNGLIQPNTVFFLKYFKIIYIPAIIIFLIFWLIVFFINTRIDFRKSSLIFIMTLLSLFIFNIFDNTKNYNKLPYFKKNTFSNYEKRNLIIILDEMSGLDSLASDSFEGNKFNEEIEIMFKKYNFEYYVKSFSISENSVNSIGSFVNFKDKFANNNRDEFVRVSKNYFVEYEMKKNELFKKFRNISVIQNLHINFCNTNNVSKCYQYNPYNLEIIKGEINNFSKIISIWNIHGSVISKVIWRYLRQIGAIKPINEPEGEKIFFDKILEYAKIDILSKKYDLVFMHILVPHKPYGFNNECDYDVSLSNLNLYLPLKDSIKLHNVERRCVVKFMDNFFKDIGDLDNLNIFIISDHGSRLKNTKRSSLSNIFAHKDFDRQNSTKIIEEHNSHYLFMKKLND